MDVLLSSVSLGQVDLVQTSVLLELSLERSKDSHRNLIRSIIDLFTRMLNWFHETD